LSELSGFEGLDKGFTGEFAGRCLDMCRIRQIAFYISSSLKYRSGLQPSVFVRNQT
jgi:hypothetical protein